MTYLQNLLKPKDVIVIATSTGPDSMFLLHLLLQLKDQYKLKIIVAHVNHNVRKESLEEEEFIRRFTKEHELILEYLKITAYSNDNFHNEARKKRYEFFYEVVHKYQAKYLMTAHHGDDLMETILMRLTRGSSLNGYVGIKKQTIKEDFQIIRPLLYMTKDEIKSYMDNNDLKYYLDASNNSSKYTRNRYRKEVLPFLKKENKDVHLKYLEFSEELEQANNYIEKIVLKKVKAIYKDNIIDISKLKNTEDFILKKILGVIFKKLYQEDLDKINKKHVQKIIEMIKSSKASLKINLPGNIIAVKEYNNLKFLNTKEERRQEYKYILKQEVTLPNGNIIKQVLKSDKTDNYHIYLNSQEIKLPIIVRSRQSQDKMAVKNLNGTKKIQDILVNAKVPKSQRDSLPIVVDSQNNILWIPSVKKSKFDKAKTKNYDIILKYQLKEGKNNE